MIARALIVQVGQQRQRAAAQHGRLLHKRRRRKLIGQQPLLRHQQIGLLLPRHCTARAQHAHIAEARAGHDLVVCDTTALMTAVYSRIVFGDTSLDATAADWHKADISLSLLTALDLPWVSDGLQRDGAHVREPVDSAVRELLQRHALPWVLVSGSGTARVEAAIDAVAPLLRARATPRRGLLTRLQQRDAAAPVWNWVCEKCDAPECEHAQLRQPRL